MSRIRFSSSVVLSLFVALAFAREASAQNQFWWNTNAAPVQGFWSVGANWSNDLDNSSTAPIAGGSNDYRIWMRGGPAGLWSTNDLGNPNFLLNELGFSNVYTRIYPAGGSRLVFINNSLGDGPKITYYLGGSSYYGHFYCDVVLSNTLTVAGPGAQSLNFYGPVSGPGGLVETLSTTPLRLWGTNSYQGLTIVSNSTLAGLLGVAIPSNSNLRLSNLGKFMTGADITRALGTGANEIQLTDGTNGLSAALASPWWDPPKPVAVNFGGNGGLVTWGSASFNPSLLTLNAGLDVSGYVYTNIIFVNALDLNGATRRINVAGSFTAPAIIAGPITNNGGSAAGLTKEGAGLLILTGTNGWDGTLNVTNGVVRAVDGVGLPAIAPLALGNGALEGLGTITRGLGTGAGNVQLPAGGISGFSARDGLFTVNLGGAQGLLKWTNSTVFNPGMFLLNEVTANTNIALLNGLDVNGATRRIRVNAGTATIYGPITNTGALPGGFVKDGAGTLVLAGTNYNAAIIVSNGALRVASLDNLPPAGKLTLSSGVIEFNGQFTRALGSGDGQVQFTNNVLDSGFSAYGGPATVNLHGDGRTVVWSNTTFFNPSRLTLNAATANDTLTFLNGLDLNGAMRTVGVYAAWSAPAVMRGPITNTATTAAGLTKIGSGVLELTGTNYWTLPAKVAAGTLRAVDGIGLPTTANLIVTNGVFESRGTFTRALGAGAGQVMAGGSVGFSAQGGPLAVSLGGMGTPTPLMGQLEFNISAPLILNTYSADSKLTFYNQIYLTNATYSQPIEVRAAVAEIAANITNLNSGNIRKDGLGTLVLSATNFLLGRTLIYAGTLIVTNGGIHQSSSDTLGSLFVGGGSTILGSNCTFIVSGGMATNVAGAGGGFEVSWYAGSHHNRMVVDNGGIATDLGGETEIGNSGTDSRLEVLNNGFLWVYALTLGVNAISTNNSALVAAGGEVRTTASGVLVGDRGSFNSMVVSNAGRVNATAGAVGNTSSSNNWAIVTGSGSIWSNAGGWSVGRGGAFNTATVADSGQLHGSALYVGSLNGASNTLNVTGVGTLCRTWGPLYVGAGQGNQLTVSAGGLLSVATTAIITNGSTVLVTGSGSAWTNIGNVTVGLSGTAPSSIVVSNGGALRFSGTLGLGTAGGAGNSLTVYGANASSLWATNGLTTVTNGATLAIVGSGGDVRLKQLALSPDATLSFTFDAGGITPVYVATNFTTRSNATMVLNTDKATMGSYTLIDYYNSRTGGQITNIVVNGLYPAVVDQNTGGKITARLSAPKGTVFLIQ